MFILSQQVPRKFNMKKRFVLVIILLLILSLSILVLVHYTTMSYSLSGTYSAGNEPHKDNICIVLKDEKYTIYDQEKILESGLFEEIDLDSKSDVYKLVSGENTRVGYMIHDRNHIILLDFKGMDFSLKKISASAIYLNYKSE